MQKQGTKEAIKYQLWRIGHAVKDVSEMSVIGFDLIVNDKWRVAIWDGNEDVDCDIFARVFRGQKRYALKSKNLKWVRPSKIFGKPKTRPMKSLNS